MKKNLFIFVLLVTAQLGFSQQVSKNTTVPSIEEAVYMTEQVTVKPEFPGGTDALQVYIKRNFKKPKVKGLKGDVLVSFIIEKNGHLTEVGVLSDAGHGTGDEAIRIMEISPNWIPASLNGNPVRVQYLLTISLDSLN